MQGSERASAEPAMAIAEGHAHMSEVMARILHSEMKPKAEVSSACSEWCAFQRG